MCIFKHITNKRIKYIESVNNEIIPGREKTMMNQVKRALKKKA